MENKFKQVSGYGLIIGSSLLVATMILHPTGGSIEQIVKSKTFFVSAHSLALLSLPFITFGFFGLTTFLTSRSRISFLALFFSIFGLVAAMIAGAVNGFALPLFLSKITEQSFDVYTITSIIKYGFYINASMDYISLAFILIAISIWSMILIRDFKQIKWLGYYGLIIFFSGLITAVNGYNLAGLFLFRIVVFAIVSWIILAAYKLLIKS